MSGAARPRARRLAALAAAALLLLSSGCGGGRVGASDEPLLVAAASDLGPAFTELAEDFTAATGHPVDLTFGSSGQLAQQIAGGAPHEVFASASTAFVDSVVAAGRGDDATRATYGYGRLVLWSTAGRWEGWTDLVDLAGDREVEVVAIANPAHAPYGAAAEEALAAAGVLDGVVDRLAYGQNVADAQRLAATGNADAAVVALSLALAGDERGEGRWELLDDALHAPLEQQLVVTAEDPGRAALAARFVAFVGSEQSRDVLRRFGFLLPGEEQGGAPA